MHLLVTDRLCCARCGPSFGLVLLADELTDRRVIHGALGCSNCRERYPVEDGFGDLRPPPRIPRAADEGAPLPQPDPEEAFRLAALVGLREGPGLVVLMGRTAAQAARFASIVEGIETVAIGGPELRAAPEEPGVSRIDAGSRLPFFTGSIAGVVMEGGGDAEARAEARRVLARGARLVVRSPADGVARALEDAGFSLLLETPKAVVASRE